MLKDLIASPKELAYLRALHRLRKAGWNVGTGDRPGLTYVSGNQMTEAQVIALASRH
jgi:hypothetical protein